MDEINKLEISDTTHCYVCGSDGKSSSNSLHVWEILYECGCKIWGPLGKEGIYLDTECPNEK